ncbi:L-threonylcarbamoyladenylate synthase [Schaalia sp. Marseille-Q2122]|uniref:L-threonylcarbamoyladenylate synthase n=1 Tax=Schaalia sp. Marseille-Q2122 TaxID=2736604 RepID=UPI00158A3C92|nr:L-threonylcarbamoyladenylate synthase [Schaalia sp. Marseille-Q2122]
MTRSFSALSSLASEDCQALAALVRGGGVIVVPTDTVYGIGTIATKPESITRLLAAKGRDRQMPPPVLVPSTASIDELCVNVPEAAYRLAQAYWPGGLTLILEARPDLGWDLGDTKGTLAVRMPDHEATLALLEATGPMAVTSANTTGNPPALSIEEARDYFADRVDAYVDGGPSAVGRASSIIDLAHGQARAVRVGALSLEELSEAAGTTIAPPPSPSGPPARA